MSGKIPVPSENKIKIPVPRENKIKIPFPSDKSCPPPCVSAEIRKMRDTDFEIPLYYALFSMLSILTAISGHFGGVCVILVEKAAKFHVFRLKKKIQNPLFPLSLHALSILSIFRLCPSPGCDQMRDHKKGAKIRPFLSSDWSSAWPAKVSVSFRYQQNEHVDNLIPCFMKFYKN